LVATATESIEQAVVDEKLDCGRADEILTGAEDRVIVQVNGRHSARRGGPIICHRRCIG